MTTVITRPSRVLQRFTVTDPNVECFYTLFHPLHLIICIWKRTNHSQMYKPKHSPINCLYLLYTQWCQHSGKHQELIFSCCSSDFGHLSCSRRCSSNWSPSVYSLWCAEMSLWLRVTLYDRSKCVFTWKDGARWAVQWFVTKLMTFI